MRGGATRRLKFEKSEKTCTDNSRSQQQRLLKEFITGILMYLVLRRGLSEADGADVGDLGAERLRVAAAVAAELHKRVRRVAVAER